MALCADIMVSKNPTVMGILNVTPDSFSDGGNYVDAKSALVRLEKMMADGAGIIDIGGESTRPNCMPVDEKTEWNRLGPILKFATNYGIPISVDTYKLPVAELALKCGVSIVNDVCTFDHLDGMIDLVKKYNGDLVVTHNCRNYQVPEGRDIVQDVVEKFQFSIDRAERRDFDPNKLILDIGLGFGKTPEQEVELISKLGEIREKFTQRLLIGASKKSFMRIFGELTPDDRMPCTLAATIFAYMGGCDIFRVHDVRENVEVLKFAKKIWPKKR